MKRRCGPIFGHFSGGSKHEVFQRLLRQTTLSGALIAVVSAYPLVAQVALPVAGPPSTSTSGAPGPNAFVIHSYEGKSRCLDYTPGVAGSAVFLNDCEAAHPVIVEESSDGKHRAILHAGDKLIGIERTLTNSPGVASSAQPSGELPLVLVNAGNNTITSSLDYFFYLDGDSIILASSMPEPPTGNPVLVAKVQNARGKVQTPIVIGPRNAADNEFWEFKATDNSDRDPTSGFIRIGFAGDACVQNSSCGTSLANYLNNMSGMRFGVVFKVAAGLHIMLTAPFTSLPTGITIRGDRRGTTPGPEFFGNFQPDVNSMFLISGKDGDLHYGDYVRITGIRIGGPTDCVAQDEAGHPDNCHTAPPAGTAAIEVGGIPASNSEPFGVLLDHNEIYDWPNAGVVVFDGQPGPQFQFGNCSLVAGPNPASVDNVRIYRNYIHHIEGGGGGSGTLGYGVAFYGGAGTVAYNTFSMNRHAIAADGGPFTEYSAISNIILTDAPRYDGNVQQDFDVHGTANPSSYYGGDAGGHVEIIANTFLGGNRDSFMLRGQPCKTTDLFSFNVTMADWPVEIFGFDGTEHRVSVTGPAPSSAPFVDMVENKFANGNPAGRFAVGDFDGDGVDDLFFATGAGWFYSPGGKTEWRFLNGRAETIDQLVTGDFDGDGRTDVMTADVHGRLMISWGGLSDPEVLNQYVTLSGTPVQIAANVAAGNFTGDERSDLFLADGTQWWVSDGGQAPFIPVQTSSAQVKDLRFGDFNGDRRTDVFGVGAINWQVSFAPTPPANGLFSSWSPLRPKLTDSAQGLYVADFDGDGIADVASDCGNSTCWNISSGGRNGWNNPPQPYAVLGSGLAGIGKFSGNNASQPSKVDVLFWDENRACDTNPSANHFCISDWGAAALERYSFEKMR